MPDSTVTFTDEQKTTLRTAAYGAVQLLSIADPGILSAAKENIAGAKVLNGATGPIGQVLSAKAKVKLKGSVADVAAIVLPALGESITTLAAKDPGLVEEFRRVINTATKQAASAPGGRSQAQADMLAKIAGALEPK